MHDIFVFFRITDTICVYIDVYFSLKHHDRKINMPTTFIVKKNLCIRKHARVHGNTCCTSYNLPIQVIMHFYPQNLFKIHMKVVSLKMVTNMYWDLRSKCASEYL